MRDLASNIAVVNVLSPVVLAATNTSAALDLAGYNRAAVVITTGAIASAGDFTAKLQHSDTTTSGDFADTAAADRVGSFPASLVADGTVKVGYIGNKRYIRTVITKNSGTSIATAVTLLKGDPAEAPVS